MGLYNPVPSSRVNAFPQSSSPSFAQRPLSRKPRLTIFALVILVPMMVALYQFQSLKAVALALLSSSIVKGQSATSTTSNADGLTTVAGSATASVVTVTNDGHVTTYRVIPTLAADIDNTPPVLPNIYDPSAVNAQTVCPGYTASNVAYNKYGFTASLTLAGTACNVYGTDVEDLSLTVQYQSDERLAVKIVPTYLSASNITQYYVPSYYVNEPGLEAGAASSSRNSDLEITYSNTPTFSFKVIRKSTGDTLFDTTGTKLVFENQFVEFVSALPTNYNLYGLGERIHGLRLGNNFTATIYAADAGDPIDGNIYGSHPFYLDTRYYKVGGKGKLTLVTSDTTDSHADYVSYSHGVYLRNTHGQEVVLAPESVTWRTLGGSIELYFYSGNSQPEVTYQHQSVIGMPAMQQYFTFGYHQCRWGYTNWTELQDVVDNMANFGIPLENIWTDIDYMNQYRDFDNDQNRFSYAEGKKFLAKLHANGQHYIPIVDSAIYIPNPSNASDTYATYDRGNKSNAFMVNAAGTQYIGAVWPGFTVFPDWHAAGTQAWWTNEMALWHSEVAFDGIWIDMSEVSSFCVGSCGTGRVTENPVHPPFELPGELNNIIFGYPEDFDISNATDAAIASASASGQNSAISATATPGPTTTTPYLRTTPTPGVRNTTFPPYAINNVNGALPVHAISPDSVHADGTQDYDIHNLFGHEIINATYNALLNVFPGKRPFIIGRSNFAGSGSYAGHWGGDNTALWEYMYFSIPQALSNALFGIPMFGVDTCGFNGNTDEELCNRWMQLSAFFPFYRNHNVLSAISQEPYRWASVIGATKTAMQIRYSLLPYIYTLMYHAHNSGSTVMRALAWEFPSDPSLAAADRQFLLGPSILVTPVLQPLATNVSGVFPGIAQGTKWYDWYTQKAVSASAGQNVTIQAPLGHIPVYVRGGSVLPMQEPGYTTAASRKNEWSLLVALSKEATASGDLYLDDGESLNPATTKFVDFSVSGGKLEVAVRGKYAGDANTAIANVTIIGLPHRPTTVSFNGAAAAHSYSAAHNVLSVTGLAASTTGGAWTADWTLTWA